MAVLLKNLYKELPASMVFKGAARFFKTFPSRGAAEVSTLAQLRKKTGYTFANCKKALQMHNNDINKAESWLREEAQKMGWEKAIKLEGRAALQGLIAVNINPNAATLVEVNCETDFVARNNMFQDLVEEISNICLSYESQMPKTDVLSKTQLNGDELSRLQIPEGKTLADHLAMFMGTLGEKISLRRALCIRANSDLNLFGYSHPSGVFKNNTSLGRIGAVIALRQQNLLEEENMRELGKSLCQHIVGMNPKKIGTKDDKPMKNSDDEICLIHQEFLDDPDVTVGEILEEKGVEVVYFKRFECGENLLSENVLPLELVQTCQ